ncbi:MAG: sugar transferase [Armatimonadota bacterium]
MSPKIPIRFFWLLDFLVLAAAFLAAFSLTPHVHFLFAPGGALRADWLEALMSPALQGGHLPPFLDMVWVLGAMAPLTLVVLSAVGAYGDLLAIPLVRLVVGSLLAPLAGLSIVTLALFAFKRLDWSRLFIFSFTLLGGIGLAGYRMGLRRYFSFRRAGGYYAKNLLLIAVPAAVGPMVRYLDQHVPAADVCPVGYLDAGPPDDGTQEGAAAYSIPRLGHVAALRELLVHHPIHEVIVVHPASGGPWLHQVIEDCDYFGVALRILPDALFPADLQNLQALHAPDPIRLPTIVLAPPHWDSEALFLKRVLDIVISATLLLLFVPLMGVIALAIRLTYPSLPVFYRWRVVGYQGVPFIGYKFTTMVADADERKAELLAQNEMTGPVFKIRDDPRVTPLGRFLRKYSLNELPQLWSVLRGDMSLVGPRPAFPHELERYEVWHKRKLSIRPGITCLWQVRGRNRIRTFDDWVRMDLEYIENWSLWLDIKILVRTVWVMVTGTGS